MAYLPPNSPYGLPSSPRQFRQTLSPLDTSLRPTTSPGPSPYSASTSEKQSPQGFVDTRVRNANSRIFADATIPLSPVSSTSNSFKEDPHNGLAPRRRNAFARLFCCFGREERARRRMRFAELEPVGVKCHWSEL